MVQNNPLGKMPGFKSWRISPGPGSNTSTQTKAKAPRCIRPSVPLKLPFMKRISLFTNGSVCTSPVAVSVGVTSPLMYAKPRKPLKSVIVEGSASGGSKPGNPGPKT